MSNPNPIQKETLTFLKSYILESSLQRLGLHTRGVKLSLREIIENPNDSEYAEEISIIMLWGNPGSFVLKTHFNLSSARYFTSQGLMRKESDITDAIARDFMKEFGNLQAGHLRGVFGSNQVALGMSLPFLALGKDERVFKKIRDPRASFYLWKMDDGNQHSVTCTAEIYLCTPKIIEDIRHALERDMNQQTEKKQEADPTGVNTSEKDGFEFL